jgi:hypothetical protein
VAAAVPQNMVANTNSRIALPTIFFNCFSSSSDIVLS